MADDPYLRKYRQALKKCKNDAEIETVIDRVYENGYQDGYEDQQ